MDGPVIVALGRLRTQRQIYLLQRRSSEMLQGSLWLKKTDCGGAAGEDGAGRKQADLGGGQSISLPVLVNPCTLGSK